MQTDGTKTKQRYDRVAPYYDKLERGMEFFLFRHRRRILWDKVKGKDILEIGVGTGINFSHYPSDAKITAIDFSEKMLQQANLKKQRDNIDVELSLMDVQSLCYADNSFDTVVATCVFCSVPQPIRGLQELYRVCKPGGQILLLEHVLSSQPIMAKMMQMLNPLVLKMIGANINRHTIKNVQACSFKKVIVDTSSSDMVKLIQAIK